MEIVLDKVGKRYHYDWIFREIDFHFKAAERYAILGPNGSGKSTLMRVLSGHLTPSQGTIKFNKNNSTVSKDDVYHSMSYAAPYIDLIEELTLKESIAFHSRFKPLLSGVGEQDLLNLLAFENADHKYISNFSSGMKQRLKLILAICSDTPVLLLDEPTTNLDQQGMDWYLELIDRFAGNRLIVVASNVEMDYRFCSERLSILDYKHQSS